MSLTGNALQKVVGASSVGVMFGLVNPGDEVETAVYHDSTCRVLLDHRAACDCEPDVFLTHLLTAQVPRGLQ